MEGEVERTERGLEAMLAESERVEASERLRWERGAAVGLVEVEVEVVTVW